jgi:hypothetical protein
MQDIYSPPDADLTRKTRLIENPEDVIKPLSRTKPWVAVLGIGTIVASGLALKSIGTSFRSKDTVYLQSLATELNLSLLLIKVIIGFVIVLLVASLVYGIYMMLYSSAIGKLKRAPSNETIEGALSAQRKVWMIYFFFFVLVFLSSVGYLLFELKWLQTIL